MVNRAFDKYFVHDNAEIRNEVMGEVDYMNEIAKRLWEGVDEAVENYRFGAGTEGETKFSKSGVDESLRYNVEYTQGGESNDGLGQTISDEVQGSTFRAGNIEHTFSVDKKERRGRKITVSGRTTEVLSSSEETAEQKRIKQQLKAENGRDMYFTTDGTYFLTDSAVFMPADIFEGDGFTLSDRQASFSEDRFNYLVSTYSVKTGGEGSQNYSKGYVTYISPSDFLALTTTNEQHIVEDARNKYYKLDVDVLKNERQTPFLRIDLQTGEVTGHEGRHRMALLRDAGIEKVAIVIEADSEAGKYNAQKLTNFKISGQEFNSGKAPGTVVLDEVIPLSPKYRNEAKEKFVDVESDVKYSVSDNDGNIIPLSERFDENEKDIRYQISENAEKDVQALLDGKKFTEDIKLTDSSPSIILGHKGVKNLPMLMKPSHILENILTEEEAREMGLEVNPDKIHYHGLGKTLFLDIIRGLDDVNQAYRGTKNAADSSRRENYFLLISTLKDAEGNVINVPVYINEHGQWHNVEIKTNKIGTVFGREQLQRYIQKEIKNGNLVRIKKRSSLVGELAGDKVPTSYGEATSRGGSEVSERPTTKADDYYSIASETIILNSTEKSQEKISKTSENLLTDETKASISDAGMRLTDDSELSSLLREQEYKEEIERLKGELVKSKRMGGKGKNRLMRQDINRIAREIISDYSSEIGFATLRDELTGLYELMDNIEMQGSEDYSELVKLSNDIAKSVIARSYVDITDQNAEEYKAAMRSHRLTPSLQDVAELEQMFGTFGAAYRQYGRKLNMRAQGTPGALHIDETRINKRKAAVLAAFLNAKERLKVV